MTDHDRDLLTLAEVARRLRCSKTHVSNLVNGRLVDIPALTAVRIGRRILVRQSTLEAWISTVEAGRDRLGTPETAAGRMAEGAHHA